jgi:hypothetical protein
MGPTEAPDDALLPEDELLDDALRHAQTRHIEERALMKIAPWYLAALAPFAAIGYSGAHLGHAFVVLLTIAIFLGTLTIGNERILPGPKTDP